MTACTVRVGVAADRPWLLSIDRHVSAEWVDRTLAMDGYLVAEVGGTRVGFLRHSLFWGRVPFMDEIQVDPAYRRSGVGTSLFTRWEADSLARGALVLMTSSQSDEPEPQAWHRRNGFVDSGSLTFGAYQRTPEQFFIKDLSGGADPCLPD